MPFEEPVAAALGNRAQPAYDGAGALMSLGERAPKFTDCVFHLNIPLDALDRGSAEAEMATKIRMLGHPADWAFMVLHDSDGVHTGKATPFFRDASASGELEWSVEFLLSEFHIRLGAWWLTHLWRAAELAEEARSALGRWRLVSAAASARSLLEGAAYLAVEVPALTELWSNFKKRGVPTADDVVTILAELSDKVLNLQYASRLGQGHGLKPQFPSKNVMNYIDKLAKRRSDINVVTLYEWLCDAVHPSVGSALTYRVYGVFDDLRSNQLERYERSPLNAINEIGIAGRSAAGKADPPFVAYAVADALVLAAELIERDLATARWVLDDICLTGGLKGPVVLQDPLILKRSERNAPCACGSGLKTKKCVHRWGLSAVAPSSECV